MELMDQWREGCGLPPPRTIDPVVKEEGRGRRRARRGAWVGVSRHFVLTLCIGGILAQEWKTSPPQISSDRSKKCKINVLLHRLQQTVFTMGEGRALDAS